jgi:hypothetical protein
MNSEYCLRQNKSKLFAKLKVKFDISYCRKSVEGIALLPPLESRRKVSTVAEEAEDEQKESASLLPKSGGAVLLDVDKKLKI